ncbi:hypothetical protein ACGFOU_17855 [Streptomyces sp. NPDC048595]|uniref:hypothetical protein n=1 Tax=Streptomyces sp. NPDC048595 TaxID=3365576 RepID=UPI0037196D13
MRIRTTLFAVTLATAALLGGAATAAADTNPDYSTPRSSSGADLYDAPMGRDVTGEGAKGSDGASRRGEDESPGGLVGRLTGGI